MGDKKKELLVPLEKWLNKGESNIGKMFRDDARARWVDFEQNMIIEGPETFEALDFLKSSNNQQALVIGGGAGCGKSTLLYTLGYQYIIRTNKPVYYFNVAEFQMSNIGGVVDEAISLPEETLILFDDLHQNAVLANKVIGAILAEATKIRIVTTTRPPYFEEVRRVLRGPYGWRTFAIVKIELKPVGIFNSIIDKFIQTTGIQMSEGTIQKLKRDIGQDLTVLGWVLSHISEINVVQMEYDEAVLRYRFIPILENQELGVDALALLYTIASFEQFDVRLRREFLLKLSFTEKQINNLVTAGIIVQRQDVLEVGHANLARLYVKTLDRHIDLGWMASLVQKIKSVVGSLPNDLTELKIALINAFFKQREVTARSRAILNVFHYFSPEIRLTEIHQQMIYMVSAVERAIEMLILYFQRDPTAENSVSNSAFIGQVFSKLGRMDLAKQALDFILAQQASVSEEGSAKFILDPLRVTTVKDFGEIKRLTAEEDENPNELTIELLQRVYGKKPDLVNVASQTNFDQFHQTWLSAMVLPPIAMVYGKDHPEEYYIRTLNAVLANQDTELGWFYPAEFCWSTARCITNLVQIGIPVDSKYIRGGIDWLLRIQLKDGRWHSPDWRWNPDEEMTAMCLYALLQGGLANTHPAINRASRWIMSQERNGRWCENAHDTGHVVEALNALDFPLEKLRPPLKFLEDRVSTDDWYQTIIGKERRQSLEIGELANVLLDVETNYLFGYVREVLKSK